jgi:FK506-binding protein 1
MGVEKIILKPGDGITTPKKHDEVSMEYTGNPTLYQIQTQLSHTHSGWLYDEHAPNKKGIR